MQPKYKLNRTTQNSQSNNVDFSNFNAFTTNYAKGMARKRYHERDLAKSPNVNYTLENVNRWLQNPSANEENLRKLSSYLYDTNPTYKIIVRYMALLLRYNWTLSLDTFKGTNKKIKDDFQKVSKYLNLIINEFEFQKASLVAYKNDVFYGYEIETNDSYFIFHLDPSLCKIISMENGINTFAFNFQYFDSRQYELDLLPDEFRLKYNMYKATKENWIELDVDKSICLKVNPETRYPVPPFSNMFSSIYDSEYYKKIKKERAAIDNYLLLQQKIPMDDKEQNKFLLGLEHVNFFHQAVSDGVHDGVSVVTSPMEITAIKTEKSKSDNDLVMEAMREVYSDGGISQFLFNSDKNTSIGLTKSIKTDEEIAFFWLRQIEARIRLKLKYKFPRLDLEFKFLNMTVFNEDEVFEKYLKAAQNGLPVKFELGAVMGLTPIDTLNKAKLENDIFGLHDLFIPLKTSHTLTNEEDKGGRPTKGDDEISDSGQTNRDNDRDSRKVDG